MIHIGYDMSTVLPMSTTEKAEYDAARKAFFAAIKVRDDLPQEEAGRLNMQAVREKNLTPYDAEAWDGTSERYDAARKAVDAASDEMDRLNKSYFRLNIGGMSRYGHAMHLLDMAYDAPSDGRPDFPDWSALTDAEHDTVYELVDTILAEAARRAADIDSLPSTELVKLADEPVRTEVVDLVKAQLATLSWTPDASRGIYLGKFWSNDGWWVSPAEISAALTTYRAASKEKVEAVLAVAGIQNQTYWLSWIGYLMYAETHGGFTVN